MMKLKMEFMRDHIIHHIPESNTDMVGLSLNLEKSTLVILTGIKLMDGANCFTLLADWHMMGIGKRANSMAMGNCSMRNPFNYKFVIIEISTAYSFQVRKDFGRFMRVSWRITRKKEREHGCWKTVKNTKASSITTWLMGTVGSTGWRRRWKADGRKIF